MNETIFILHTLFISGIVLFAKRFGKEALIALGSTLWLLANLFVVKQIELFGLNVTSSDAFVIGSTLITALLTEYYGKEAAKKAIYISFGLQILFSLLSIIHLSYLPSTTDESQLHFSRLLTSVPRIVFASITAFVVAELTSVALAYKLKVKFNSQYFTLRTFAVLLITQALDTILFGFIGLFGIVSSLMSIMLVSFLLKVIAIIITTPILTVVKRTK